MSGYDPAVLPYGPKGVAGYDATGLLDKDAYYGWAVRSHDMASELARMVWCTSDEWMAAHGSEIIPAAQADFNAGIKGRVWLIDNEPATDYGQCGSQHIGSELVSDVPRTAAWAYHSVYLTIKAADPNAKVFAGGVTNIGVPSTAQWWYTEFIDEMDDQGWLFEIEGVHIHAYPRWAVGCADPFSGGWPEHGDWCMDGMFTAIDDWYEDFHVGLGLGDRPIWITESGCASYAADLIPYGDDAWTYCRDNVMEPMQEWFDGQSDYDALYWFISDAGHGAEECWWPTALVKDGSLTPLGIGWNSWHP